MRSHTGVDGKPTGDQSGRRATASRLRNCIAWHAASSRHGRVFTAQKVSTGVSSGTATSGFTFPSSRAMGGPDVAEPEAHPRCSGADRDADGHTPTHPMTGSPSSPAQRA